MIFRLLNNLFLLIFFNHRWNMANGGNNLAVPLSFAHPRKAIIFFFFYVTWWVIHHRFHISLIVNATSITSWQFRVYVWIHARIYIFHLFVLMYNDLHKRYFTVWYMVFTRVCVCVCVCILCVCFFILKFLSKYKPYFRPRRFFEQCLRSQWYNSTNGESYHFLFFDKYLFPFISHWIFS